MASEYGKPAACPTLRPITPQRLGPTRLRPPLSGVWHCRQRLKTSWPPSALALGSSAKRWPDRKPSLGGGAARSRRLRDRQGPSGLLRPVLLVDDVEQRLAAEHHQQGRQHGACDLVEFESVHATAFPHCRGRRRAPPTGGQYRVSRPACNRTRVRSTRQARGELSPGRHVRRNVLRAGRHAHFAREFMCASSGMALLSHPPFTHDFEQKILSARLDKKHRESGSRMCDSASRGNAEGRTPYAASWTA